MPYKPDGIASDNVKYYSGSEFYMARQLTKDQELILAKLMKLGDSIARDKLFFDNFWIIKTLAQGFKNTTHGIEIEEMIGAGVIAMLEALRDFDPAYNCRISTFARQRVYLAIWNLIISYRCGINIPNYMYKKVCQHLKEQTMSDAEFANECNISLTELEQIINITRTGIPVLSSIEEHVSAASEGEMDINDFLDESDAVKEHGEPQSAASTDVQLELKMFGEQLDEFGQKNLTRQQYRVLSLTVIPYLKGEPYMNVVEAAKHLNRTFQAVDQVLTYMKIRLQQSPTGRKYIKIIEETLKFIRKGRTKK